MHLKNLRFIFLALCTLTGLTHFAQQPAFPGAEGAGMYTTGGRGTAAVPTTVFEVTNLADDNNPGSLRYALQASATTYPHRTIVFRVSGTIHLATKLNIRGNVTIAGQTAPGGGICIADQPVVISGSNVIIRYVRFRMGDKYQNKGMVDGSGSDDALGALEQSNIIIDHCSVSWSSDEALTIYRGDNLTIQWSFISEPLNYSYHFETGDTDFERHGYGGIWGAKRGSFHHNLFAHCYSRNPRFAGISTYTPNTVGIENADFRNNVIYNWGINTVYGGEGGNYNVVNNYYRYGPNTNSGVRYRIANPSFSATVAYGKWYVDGNYVDGSPTNTANNWAGVVMQNAADPQSLAKASTAFDLGFPVTTELATDAYESVLQGAGAVLPLRDTLDQRIVNNVRARTGNIIDVQGGYPHGTPYAQTVNAWPDLASAAPPTDTDHDGMPDAWETAAGLNPADASDRAVIAANGYTALENYLNSITGTNPSITVTGSLNTFAQTAGTPSAAQTYTVAGTNLTADITVTPPAAYELSLDGVAWSNAPLTLAKTGSDVPSTSISVRLNAAGAGTYNGSISHVSTAAAINLPVSGTTASMPPAGTAVVVAQDGTGAYTTIQAAINAAPANSTTPYVIYIRNGVYKEKVNIPSNKPFLHLIGESVGGTVISWDDYSGKLIPGGGGTTYGTSTSATLTINAADCFLMNITVENTTSNTADGPQALALNVGGDRCAFKNCRFNGGQDTVLANGDGKRQYFRNCYIDGNTDFIFGSSTAVFDSCVIYPRDRYDGSAGGYVTAANTPAGQAYGYVFRNCIITKNRGVTTYTLGRPWQNDAGTPDASKKNNKVVFLNTTMGTSIAPAGWSVWDAGTNTSLIMYAEYKSKKYDGTPVDVSSRVAWSRQLSDAEAAPYFVNSNLFGSWDPCAVSGSMCTSQAPDLAVSNIRAQRQAAVALVSWNLSWPIAGVSYELYRSTNNVTFAKIYETTSADPYTVAFSYSDPLPPGGVTYYYYVKAVKTGYLTNSSFVASVNSSAPLDGEFRSAGSGYWNNASTGGTINTTSIWEKYVASSSTWVLQTLNTKPGSSTNVTIRSGHTVTLDGLNTINSLVIDNGGTLNSTANALAGATQTLRVGNGTAPVTAFIINDGTLGSTSGANDGIVLEVVANCKNLTISGAGTTSIARFRPLNPNPNGLNVVIDQNMDFNLSNNIGLTGYYNSNGNTNTEVVTLTINAGKTVRVTQPGGGFHTGATTSNPQGNITYNVNGTLDLSAINTVNLVPSSINPASSVVLNVGNGGLLKTGTAFNMTNGSGTTFGTARIVVAQGGVVDATRSATFTLSNSANSGYVVSDGGVVKRAVGVSAVTFPVGVSATAYNPVVIANTGTADNFAVNVKTTFDVTPPTTNRVDRQWNISEEVAGGSNATLKFSWVTADQTTGFSPASGVYVYHYNGASWDATPATVSGSGTAVDPYVATASGFTSFSPFTVGNETISLPVTFVQTKAYTRGSGVQVEWNTAAESNVVAYAVERSKDGSSFVQIGTVLPVNNNGGNHYAWFDAAPVAGDNFYRIKVMEASGHKFSGTMKVTTGRKEPRLVIAENPVREGVLNLQLSGMKKGLYTLCVFDAAGQRTAIKTVAVDGESLQQRILLPPVAAGVYILQLQGENVLLSQRFVAN